MQQRPFGATAPRPIRSPTHRDLGGAAGIAPAPNSQFNYPSYTVETLADRTVIYGIELVSIEPED